jgi:hypothetical protein
VIVGRLKVGCEGLGQVGPRCDAAIREVVVPEGRHIAHHQWEVRRHVIEVATDRLDSDVVGRWSGVGTRATVVLLDVRLEVVRVGHRPKVRIQRLEGGNVHVIVGGSGLSTASALAGTIVDG